VISAPVMPFDREYYEDLAERHSDFQIVSRHVIPKNSGFGTRVEAGQSFRLEMVEGAQILDVDLFNADDPSEHYSAATQLWFEGGRVSTFTRVWGTPPRTRPLATVIADRISHQEIGDGYRDHKGYGAHCNPHHWILFAGFVPNTCYDNLRTGCAMVGLPQTAIHDNLNLYMKAALEPATGKHLNVVSDAVAGDYIQFFAEVPLLVVFSLCPYGDGSVVAEDWATTPIPQRPVALEVADSGVRPRPWTALGAGGRP
jgi:uncharacterized protein YcgI (DUF1989 family)